MHARTDELLSLRDGGPVTAETARHAADCRVCRSKIERLRALRSRLRALPALRPPRSRWDAIAGRAYARPGRHRLPAAIAAGMAASLGAVALAWMLREAPAPAGLSAARTEAPAANAELMRRSMALESALRAIERQYQPRVVRLGTAGTIADIEDRIALVDYQLNYAADGRLSPSQSEQLWQQRVDLMDSLVQVRYAQARQVSY